MIKPPKYIVLNGEICEPVPDWDQSMVEELREACYFDFETRILAAATLAALPPHLRSPLLDLYVDTLEFAGLDFVKVLAETMWLFPWKVFFRAIRFMITTEADMIRRHVVNIIEIPLVLFHILDMLLDISLTRKYYASGKLEGMIREAIATKRKGS